MPVNKKVKKKRVVKKVKKKTKKRKKKSPPNGQHYQAFGVRLLPYYEIQGPFPTYDARWLSNF